MSDLRLLDVPTLLEMVHSLPMQPWRISDTRCATIVNGCSYIRCRTMDPIQSFQDPVMGEHTNSIEGRPRESLPYVEKENQPVENMLKETDVK